MRHSSEGEASRGMKHSAGRPGKETTFDEGRQAIHTDIAVGARFFNSLERPQRLCFRPTLRFGT